MGHRRHPQPGDGHRNRRITISHSHGPKPQAYASNAPDSTASCTGWGTPWAEGTAEGSSDCTIEFTRSSAHLGGTTPLTTFGGLRPDLDRHRRHQRNPQPHHHHLHPRHPRRRNPNHQPQPQPTLTDRAATAVPLSEPFLTFRGLFRCPCGFSRLLVRVATQTIR